MLQLDKTGPKHINIKLTRAKLEALVADFINSAFYCSMQKALSDSGFASKIIDEVVLVGG